MKKRDSCIPGAVSLVNLSGNLRALLGNINHYALYEITARIII